MELKNIDMTQVMGPEDTERAKKYIGQEGFVTDTLGDFIGIECSPIGKLTKCVEHEKWHPFTYQINGIAIEYSYFVPLTALIENPYVPCITKEDFTYLIALDGARVTLAHMLTVKTKDNSIQFDTLIIHIEEEKSKPLTITLGNGQKYTGEELFDKFLMFRNGSWRPFGLPKDEREYKFFLINSWRSSPIKHI